METLVALRHGQLPEESIDPMLRGEPFKVFADPRKGHIKFAGDFSPDFEERGEHRRDKNVFSPIADDLRRELRAIRNDPRRARDADWLAARARMGG